MNKFVIHGGIPLKGTVRVSGAKNAALPVMTAALLARGVSVVHNVPRINDVKMMAHLLRVIGVRVDFVGNTMTLDTSHVSFFEAPYELVSKMRASIYVLGPLLARYKQARVSFPGGCAIGARPVDLHLKAMETLGANIELSRGYIDATTDGLVGGHIRFEKTSVGATANALMASVLAQGETTLDGAALEPEIDCLVDCLVTMGASIEGRGTGRLVVHGVAELSPFEIQIIPDRIEAGTLLIAGVMTGGDVTLEGCRPEHLSALLAKLAECGVKVDVDGATMRVQGEGRPQAVNLVTQPHPGFPTDLQAQYMAMMCLADGSCNIEDTVFPDRFMHVAELNRLDADIRLDRNIAHVRGVDCLSGAEVMATDLRASAALVLAGLATPGETVVSRIYHMDRGYEALEIKLQALGADIRRVIA
ncbi:MAG: UDP-N-acetylglucosamine 1-carboxyvinyltransferase [Candidatus Cloacimonetes bacterium]|nr:UDP-N-acetylglucosamine 1-carboxyvinyltransferase [Candidatus Cloacimonadota bacterium]